MDKFQISKNFNYVEFISKDGSMVPESLQPNLVQLVLNIQALRDYLGVPIHVMSGYRSPSHNKNVGGAKNSQHLYAKAADLVVKTKTPVQVKAAIEKLIKDGKMKNGGIGLYKNFIHYDIHTTRRW